jgi:preprotein translocase subunit YajC
MDMLLLVLAQASAPASPWRAYLFFFGMMAIFYVMLIVPRQREMKRHRAMITGLQKGDTVVMSGGVIGEIQAIRDNQVTLRSGGSTLLVEKQMVSRKVTGGK